MDLVDGLPWGCQKPKPHEAFSFACLENCTLRCYGEQLTDSLDFALANRSIEQLSLIITHRYKRHNVLTMPVLDDIALGIM